MTTMEMHLLSDVGIQIQNPTNTCRVVPFTPEYFYNSKWLTTKHNILENKYVKRVVRFNRSVRILAVLLGVITVGALELYAIIWLANVGLLSQHSASMCGFILVGSCFITGLFVDDSLSRRFTVDHYSIRYNRK